MENAKALELIRSLRKKFTPAELLDLTKIKLHFTTSFFICSAFIFLISPFTELVNWNSFLPTPIASYMYRGTGSLFPIFPWAGYVVSGGILGSYLAEHPMVFKTAKFSLKVFIYGVILILLAFLSQFFIQVLNIQIIKLP